MFESFAGAAPVLPRRALSRVYHVGSMEVASKSETSLEGSGLSVSLHPEEWRRIAQLGAEPVNALTKETGSFLDARRLTKAQRAAVTAWGVARGYAEEKALYRYHYPEEDDDGDDEVWRYMDFTTEAGRQEQADYDQDSLDEDEVPRTRLETVKGYLPTAKLRAATMQAHIDASGVFDLLLTVYGETQTDADGVWWNERLSVNALSAPRGVIFNSRLADWKIN